MSARNSSSNLGSVHRTPGVVGIDARFQVCRETDVSLLRERLALDEVHVEHFTLPEPALLRQGFGRLKVGGQPRSNLASAVLLAEDAVCCEPVSIEIP